MVQAVNIVTGVVPYRQFLTELAGSYTSPDGTDYEAEDDKQSFRRFPFVVEVTPEAFDFYANGGFFDGTDEYREYRQLFSMQCNMRQLAETLDSIGSEEGKNQFRDAVGDKVLRGMLAAHLEVRPKGTLLAIDAIARLDAVAALTGDEMKASKANRLLAQEAADAAEEERQARLWATTSEGTAAYVG